MSVEIGLKTALASTIALLTVGYAFTVHADEVNLIPSLTVKEEYSDNVFFSSIAPRSGFMTAVSPSCEVLRRNETMSGSAKARFDAILYQGNRDETTVFNHSYMGNYRLRPSPLFDIGLAASYRINNRPDQALDNSGLVLNSVRRDRQSYSADAGYEFTELTSARVSYSFEKEVYKPSTLSDTVSHAASLRITHDMGRWLPPLKGVVDGGYAHYGFESSETDNYSLSFGGIWAFTETTNLTALMGGRYTRSSFESPQFSSVSPFAMTMVTGSSSSSGWVAQVELSRKGEVTTGAVTLNRTISVSSGRNSASETTSLDSSLRYLFSPELSATVSAGYQWDSSDAGQFNATVLNQETIRFNTGISYELFRELSFDAKYSFYRVMYKESGVSAERNALFLGLTYHYPVFGR